MLENIEAHHDVKPLLELGNALGYVGDDRLVVRPGQRLLELTCGDVQPDVEAAGRPAVHRQSRVRAGADVENVDSRGEHLIEPRVELATPRLRIPSRKAGLVGHAGGAFRIGDEARSEARPHGHQERAPVWATAWILLVAAALQIAASLLLSLPSPELRPTAK